MLILYIEDGVGGLGSTFERSFALSIFNLAELFLMTIPEPTSPVSSLFLYRFGDAEFDESDYSLRVAGVSVAVELRPLELLAALLRSPGVVLTKTELLASLWQRTEATLSDNALANAVSKLRKALGDNSGALIKTISGTGYILEGRVERIVQAQRSGVLIDLRPGQSVLGAEGYRLKYPLTVHGRNSVWLAEHESTQELTVFKFCGGGEGLAALKREWTLFKVLQESLGPSIDRIEILGSNFSNAPYWVRSSYGGDSLPAWFGKNIAAQAMSADGRLALFIRVARSVADAHSVGVLHKDIKPSNVLIEATEDGGWLPRLADFGSGKLLELDALERLGVTAMGLTVTERVSLDSGHGTLMYMAPELLVGGAPTVRSDLYALGLLLYQWLVGDFRRPLLPGWEADIEDHLLREDIAAATHGQVAHRCASVSDWMTRLESLRQRRLARQADLDASAKAQAMTKALAEARARRPLVVAAILSLALGLTASLWFYARSQRALEHARHQTEQAQAINEFLTQDLLRSADIGNARVGQPFTLKAVLDRASSRAGERFKGHPAVESTVRVQLARMYQNISAQKSAEAEWRRALALADGAGGDERTWEIRLNLVRALVIRAKLTEAKDELESVERAMGAVRLAGTDELAYLAARMRFSLLYVGQQFKVAVSYGERALLLAEQLHPNEMNLRSAIRRELADDLLSAGDAVRAKAVLSPVLAPPFAPETVGETVFEESRVMLARIQAANNEWGDATRNLQQARARLSELLGADNYMVLAATDSLGTVHLAQGQFALAKQAFASAHASSLRTLGVEHMSTHLAHLNLLTAQLAGGDASRALPGLDQERAWAAKAWGQELGPLVQVVDYLRAQAFNDLGKGSEAAAALRDLQVDVLVRGAPDRDWGLRLKGQLGRALLLQGRPAEAAPLLDEAVQGMRKLGSANWQVAPFEAARASIP